MQQAVGADIARWFYFACKARRFPLTEFLFNGLKEVQCKALANGTWQGAV